MKKSLLAIAALVCGLAFTSCETEEGEMSDVLDFTNLKAKAIAAEGGSIELSGSIKANTKIQAFGLYQLNDKDKLKPAIDLLDKMSQLKELGEDGKEFTIMPINMVTGKTIILVLYDGRKFLEMQYATYEGEEITFTTAKKYTNAKVMVWDSLTNLKPVCGAETVK